MEVANWGVGAFGVLPGADSINRLIYRPVTFHLSNGNDSKIWFARSVKDPGEKTSMQGGESAGVPVSMMPLDLAPFSIPLGDIFVIFCVMECMCLVVRSGIVREVGRRNC